jgi:hypothetical protein
MLAQYTVENSVNTVHRAAVIQGRRRGMKLTYVVEPVVAAETEGFDSASAGTGADF